MNADEGPDRLIAVVWIVAYLAMWSALAFVWPGQKDDLLFWVITPLLLLPALVVAGLVDWWRDR